MKKPKLSPAQVKVLKALAETGAAARFITGLNAHWFLSPSMKGVKFETMEKLISARFLLAENDSMGRLAARITPAGREYLASLEEAPCSTTT